MRYSWKLIEPQLRSRLRILRSGRAAAAPSHFSNGDGAPVWKPLRLVITGEAKFARRHYHLFEALAARCEQLQYVTTSRRTFFQKIELLATEATFIGMKLSSGQTPLPPKFTDIQRLRRSFLLSRKSFIKKSQQTERNIRSLANKPDVVLHIFGLYSPFLQSIDIPFVHYLDYTAELSRRNWPPNVPKPSRDEYVRWFEVESSTYRRAAHLFSMSRVVATSLVEDYGIPPSKITVVGSGGRYRDTYPGSKAFGSKQILFNGNPFERKGGDLVLAAYNLLLRRLPDATLVIVGTDLIKPPRGVINPGFVSEADAMAQLFLASDIVVAPARADPFPGFLIEAMSFGVPCVSTRIGGAPEIIDDGVNGIILERFDAEELAGRMFELLSDIPKLRLYSQAAKHKAQTNFAWSSIAERIVDRLHDISEAKK